MPTNQTFCTQQTANITNLISEMNHNYRLDISRTKSEEILNGLADPAQLLGASAHNDPLSYTALTPRWFGKSFIYVEGYLQLRYIPFSTELMSEMKTKEGHCLLTILMTDLPNFFNWRRSSLKCFATSEKHESFSCTKKLEHTFDQCFLTVRT